MRVELLVDILVVYAPGSSADGFAALSSDL